MADVRAQLDYAQPLGWRKQRWVRRAIFVGTTLLLIGGSFKFFRPTLDHARLLHYQRQCLAHMEPAERLAYSGDSPSAKPDTPWERFYAIFAPPGGMHGAVVFVHELRRPDGSPRLIAVEVDQPVSTKLAGIMPSTFPLQFDSSVLIPGGVLSRPRFRFNGSWLAFDLRKQQHFRLKAGQLDAANPAHFTIGFNHDGGSGTIDGWLRDDDSILMELREPLSAREQ